MQSAAWVFGRRITSSLMSVLTVAVLARHLSPAQFGIVALAQVLLLFITLVGEAGVGTYVIYDREEDWQRRARSAFWLNVAITTAQVALCALAAPLVGSIFQQSAVTPVLLVLAGVFFIEQMAVVPEALMYRKLEHPRLARRDIALSVMTAVLSIALALRGWGVWSLVAPRLVVAPAKLIAAMTLAGWVPGWRLELRDWPKILRYTAHLMGTSLLGLFANDGDTLLVGKVLGTGQLGFYNIAWQLSNLVGRNVTAVVGVVALPALAAVKKDERRLQDAYLRTVAVLGLLCFPILSGMSVVADDLVRLLYGPQWAPVVPILRAFVVFTLVRSVTSPSSIVYNVVGRPDIGFKFILGFMPFYFLAIVVGSHWGVVGVAIGVMVVRIPGALVITFLAVRLIHVRLRTVAATVLRAAAVTSGMSVAVLLARWGMYHAGIALIPRFLSSIILGVIVYVLGVIVVKPDGYEELRSAFRSLVTYIRRRVGGLTPNPRPQCERSHTVSEPYWRRQRRVYRGGRLEWYGGAPSTHFWEDLWTSRLADDYFTDADKGNLQDLDQVLSRRLNGDGRYVEAGCGPGYWVAALRARGFNVEGVESSKRLVDMVNEVRPDLPIHHGDVTALPYPDASLDGYLSFGVVEHRREGPEPFLLEAARVLREDGALVLSVPYLCPLRIIRGRLRTYPRAVRPEHGDFFQYAFSEQELKGIVEAHGFVINEIVYQHVQRCLVEELPLYFRLNRLRGARHLRSLLLAIFSPRLAAHVILISATRSGAAVSGSMSRSTTVADDKP